MEITRKFRHYQTMYFAPQLHVDSGNRYKGSTVHAVMSDNEVNLRAISSIEA
jgi:hypothetical protein